MLKTISFFQTALKTACLMCCSRNRSCCFWEQFSGVSEGFALCRHHKSFCKESYEGETIAVPSALSLKFTYRQLFSPVTRLAFKLEVFTTLTPCRLIIHRAQHKPGEAWDSGWSRHQQWDLDLTCPLLEGLGRQICGASLRRRGTAPFWPVLLQHKPFVLKKNRREVNDKHRNCWCWHLRPSKLGAQSVRAGCWGRGFLLPSFCMFEVLLTWSQTTQKPVGTWGLSVTGGKLMSPRSFKEEVVT